MELLNPKTMLDANTNKPTLIQNEPRDESVESKWEHLQYYEEQRWNMDHHPQSPGTDQQLGQQQQQQQVDSSYSSLASSSNSSTTSSQESNWRDGSNASTARKSTKEKFIQMKKEGWRKIKNKFSSQFLPSVNSSGSPSAANNSGLFKHHHHHHPSSTSQSHSVSYHDFNTAVSTIPDGEGRGGGAVSMQPQPPTENNSSGNSIPSKIRSSKSMQNLEAITRDSYYNIRDATSNLKHKYHSRVELRQAKPKSEYEEFMDEDSDMDEEEIRKQTLEMVGLY